MFKATHISLNFLPVLLFLFFVSCTEPTNIPVKQKKESQPFTYLNHSDSAKYVGINTCKLCHQTIYNTFIKTGMGKSFDVASTQKSAANYHTSVIQDKFGDFYYKAFWQNDSLRFLEYRLRGKDTIHKRQETVSYIIGSGQHTNSHLQQNNGYLTQMPMTFYTQKKTWDLPPGFENGHNSRFARKVGLECMSCHNSYPDFVLGSENKYNSVEKGIGCERCHGPGSLHVEARQTGSKIDTSKYIDYSIVNPAKLSIDAQFDICQRCHLQGNTILKEGKSFYDFKPGMKLNDYMTVFLPKYKNADDEFIMASHADRLKQSKCFIAPSPLGRVGEGLLKPYKNALTCVTCHNPHISVKETNTEVFNNACISCHPVDNKKINKFCSDKNVIQKSKIETQNCVSCHMPKSGSIDIPHVTVHDHYIRKPITKKDKQALKQFIGLYAINEKTPSNFIKAKAYLNQYDKFEPKPYYLDSAVFYLNDNSLENLKTNIEPLIQLYFIKQNYQKITSYVNLLTDDYLLTKKLITKTFDNENAWTSYRIGEAYFNLGNLQNAILYLQNAVKLAPFALDFKNKLATAYASNNQINEAEATYSQIITENSKHVSALTNLGFIKLQKGNVLSCETLYNKAILIDPDYEPLLLNLAGLFAYKKDFKQAEVYLTRILKRNANNKKAKQALSQIKLLIKK